ncbi:MAG: response regulator transcription factor [Oscillospiraceae bacterium]|nr:response regulator transcription factor [Oscillospiraceae bacterium]
MRILIVEDEPVIAQTIADLVDTQGDSALLAYDGLTGLDYASRMAFDVIVLDVMLPGLDGFGVVRTLRQRGIGTPVLMLTALGTEDDKVTGLDSGADYYLTKPFSNRELLACLRALGRRQSQTVDTALAFADLRLEPETGMLACNGRSVRLSRKESELMSLFLRRGDQVVSKEEILRRLWPGEGEENNVEVYISFLRKKLLHLGSRAAIRTLRMVGYRLEAQS